MLSVVFYLCCVGLFLTLSLLGPIFVGLLSGEVEVAQRLAIYLLLGGFLFAGPVLATLDRRRRVPQIGSLLLIMLVWTVIPLIGAIPILDVTDLSFVDALFEGVSGITTTGSTSIRTIDALPQSIVFWRSQLQWMGGFLALLTVFAILAPLGIGGLSVNSVAASKGGSAMVGSRRIWNLIGNFGGFYVGITLAAFLVFLFTGVRSFHSASLAMAAVSTGGFLPFDKSLDLALGPVGLLAFAFFLLTGATSVFWHRMIFNRNLSRLRLHRESYSVMIVAGALALAFALILISVSGGGASFVRIAFIEGILNAASLVATSGAESRPGVFSLLPLPLILFVVLLGGSAYSTSGGLKHYRIGGMIVQSWSELDLLIYPNAVRPSKFGTQHYDLQLMKAIWSFFVVAILVISIGTIFVASSGIPFEASLTATISSFATAGPVYNSGWEPPGGEPWPHYADFPDRAKLTLMAVMLLGRLEVLAIIGIFSLSYWRSR